MRSRYSAYSGTSVRDGMSCAMNVTFSRNSGCCSRNRSNELKPRSTFFDRSARSTRRIRCSRRRVDRQRVGADPDLAVLPVDDAGLHVDVELHQVAAALQEVAPVGARVEADDVVGEDPAEDLLAQP